MPDQMRCTTLSSRKEPGYRFTQGGRWQAVFEGPIDVVVEHEGTQEFFKTPKCIYLLFRGYRSLMRVVASIGAANRLWGWSRVQIGTGARLTSPHVPFA